MWEVFAYISGVNTNRAATAAFIHTLYHAPLLLSYHISVHNVLSRCRLDNRCQLFTYRYISLSPKVQYVFCDPYAKLYAYSSCSPILFTKFDCDANLLSVPTPSKLYISFRSSARSCCSIMSSKTSNVMFLCYGTGCSPFKYLPTLKMVLNPS